MTTCYCLRFETPPDWMARSTYLYPSGSGRPGCTPKGLCSIFVASYDPQVYDGRIRTHGSTLLKFGANWTETTASNSSSVILFYLLLRNVCQSHGNTLISTSVFVAADERFLASRCLTTDYSVTILWRVRMYVGFIWVTIHSNNGIFWRR
jgi:hypothetical protein